MTLAGWLMMLLSVGGMGLFLGWCLYNVISTPQAIDHLHSQADMHPPDEHEP